MGDKDAARRLMQQHGVPTVPGTEILANVEEAIAKAREIGYPIIMKARAGGGGKGIRIVNAESEIEMAFQTAYREAESAFGDGSLYLEKYISPAKHIEVQLLADEKGPLSVLGNASVRFRKTTKSF